jgi:hypothetical protein
MGFKMKKNHLVIIAALVVVIIIGISFFYPPAEEDDTAGTIGKVEKFRNSKTEQGDIILRNELLKDTAALNYTIGILDYYNTYLASLSNEFKEWESELKSTNIQDAKLQEQLKQLNLLTLFMNNNLSTVTQTRDLLYKYYTKDTLSMSVDIQNNLIQFDSFITNLSEKDKVIDSLFVNLNGLIEEKQLKLLVSTKEQSDLIKKVREKMLGSIMVYGYWMGNESRLDFALSNTVLDALILNRQLNATLNNIAGSNAVNAAWAKTLQNVDQLSVFMSRNELSAVLKNNNISAVLANKDKLGSGIDFPIITATVAAAIQNRPLGRILNIELLGIVRSNGNRYAFSNQFMATTMSANLQLSSRVLSQSSLGSVAYMAKGLENIWRGSKDQLGSL